MPSVVLNICAFAVILPLDVMLELEVPSIGRIYVFFAAILPLDVMLELEVPATVRIYVFLRRYCRLMSCWSLKCLLSIEYMCFCGYITV